MKLETRRAGVPVPVAQDFDPAPVAQDFDPVPVAQDFSPAYSRTATRGSSVRRTDVLRHRCRCLFVRLATVIALVLLGTRAIEAATRYDPTLRFQSITTTHFVIHFHQGEEALALRLAVMAEPVHADLSRRLQHEPRERTHVVLVDQDDDSNGWTTVLPYNLVEITVAPPSGASTIGNTDDWLRMVFTHEYAHVLHLDAARGWANAARRVFGRAFFAFPNLTLPLWQIEGIATYEESRGGQGRVPAGDFHAILSEAARAGRVEPLDRVNGGLAAWPAGYGWYAYGAYFHQYLADRFGEATLGELARRTSGRAPYVTSGGFGQVSWVSPRQFWREFPTLEQGDVRASGPSDRPARVTHHGYLTDGPRFEPDGSLLYARVDAHGFPALDRVRPGSSPVQLATRYGGGQISPARDAIYFDQLELVRNVGLVSDVYGLNRETGHVARLTHGARLSDPDLSPDRRRLAAIRTARGERRLVVLDREALERGGEAARLAVARAMVFGSDGDVMATPRWSPDGTRIVVESRAPHEASTIRVFDVDRSGSPGHIVAVSGGRAATPAWTPDGRAILYADAPTGEPFNLRCARLDAAGASTAVTQLAGGARSPDLSADGRTIAFIGYTASGQDVFTVPFSCPASPAGEAPSTSPTAQEFPSRTDDPAPARAATPYRPWSTLWPRAWMPVVDTSDDEVRVGAAAGGVDALGYHAWASVVTWSVARSSDLEPVSPGARPDVQVSYAYDRWRPTVFARYGDETTPLRLPANGEVARPIAIRERSTDVGVILPFRRIRFSQALLASYRFEHDTIRGPLDDGRFDRGALRAGWSLHSAKRYGYSISPEGGVALGAGVERAAEALGGDGDATFVRADARAYLPLGPRHAVLALRATGARSSGDRRVQRMLRLGGSDADPAVLSFDDDASSLLRGFPANQFVGTRLALVNAEYRLPLGWIERGVGTWPVFLRSLHATAFFDTGHAWTMTGAPLGDWARSWGGEISTDVVAGFVLPVTLTAGVGWGRDGQGRVAPSRTAYVRIGHGF